MRYTLPPSIFRLLALALQISKHDVELKAYRKIFELARNLSEKLGAISPELGIKVYLELLLTINRIDSERAYDEYTYEVASECLLLYETQISDAAKKQTLLLHIINAYMKLNCLSNENYDTLAANVTSYCSKILKKNEQCLVLLNCCYLYTNAQAEKSRIQEILKRCAKLAKSCVDQSITNLSLFFNLLDSYVYFRQKQLIPENNSIA